MENGKRLYEVLEVCDQETKGDYSKFILILSDAILYLPEHQQWIMFELEIAFNAAVSHAAETGYYEGIKEKQTNIG